MELASYEYRDPERLLGDVLDRTPPRLGEVALALVRDPSGVQQVEHVRIVRPDEWRNLDDSAHAGLLYDIVEQFDLTPVGRPEHSIMTIIAREGFAVFGPDEGRWMHAWLFSNAFGVFKGNVMTLTPDGWVDWDTLWAGHEPVAAST